MGWKHTVATGLFSRQFVQALKQKFLSLASDAVPVEHANAIWDAIFRLDAAETVPPLTGLLRSQAAQAATS